MKTYIAIFEASYKTEAPNIQQALINISQEIKDKIETINFEIKSIDVEEDC
jgi:hypothetical protein